MEPCFREDVQSVWNTFFGIAPWNLYEFADEASREVTLYLAEFEALGMGGGILLVSLCLKTLLTPFNMVAQIQGKFLKF